MVERRTARTILLEFFGEARSDGPEAAVDLPRRRAHDESADGVTGDFNVLLWKHWGRERSSESLKNVECKRKRKEAKYKDM